jgi:cytochrome c-type biogenesis protein CcmH/NrfF
MRNSLPRPNRLALGALLTVALAMGSVPLNNPRVRSLGELLKCQCGCPYTVSSCDMQNCHFAEPVREELLKMVESGMTEKQILDVFEKRYGKLILTRPPAEGFYLLGWVMPFVGLGLGLTVIVLLLQRYMSRRQATAAAAGPVQETPELSRYREQIEKDLSDLE